MVVLGRLFGQRQFASTSGYDLAFIFALGSIAGRVWCGCRPPASPTAVADAFLL